MGLIRISVGSDFLWLGGIGSALRMWLSAEALGLQQTQAWTWDGVQDPADYCIEVRLSTAWSLHECGNDPPCQFTEAQVGTGGVRVLQFPFRSHPMLVRTACFSQPRSYPALMFNALCAVIHFHILAKSLGSLGWIPPQSAKKSSCSLYFKNRMCP